MYNILIEEQKRNWIKHYWGDMLDVDEILDRTNRLSNYKEQQVIKEIVKDYKITGIGIVGENGNIYD